MGVGRGYEALMITGVVYSLVCGAVVTCVSRGDSHITLHDDVGTDLDKPLEPASEMQVDAAV